MYPSPHPHLFFDLCRRVHLDLVGRGLMDLLVLPEPEPVSFVFEDLVLVRPEPEPVGFVFEDLVLVLVFVGRPIVVSPV